MTNTNTKTVKNETNTKVEKTMDSVNYETTSEEVAVEEVETVQFSNDDSDVAVTSDSSNIKTAYPTKLNSQLTNAETADDVKEDYLQISDIFSSEDSFLLQAFDEDENIYSADRSTTDTSSFLVQTKETVDEVEVKEVVRNIEIKTVEIKEAAPVVEEKVEVKEEAPEVIIVEEVVVPEVELNTINGTDKNDKLKGSKEADVINGEEGNDKLQGKNGDDSLNGGAGKDKLYGGNNEDTLDGGAGVDKLYGQNGNDILIFDDIDSLIHGGKGIDTLKVNDDSNVTLNSKIIKNIERIDLDNGEANELNITVKDVLKTSSNDIIEILGDALDSVSAEEFTNRGEDITVNDTVFATYSAGKADIYVELGITFNDQILTEM